MTTEIISPDDLSPEQRVAFDKVAEEIVSVVIFHRATLKMVGNDLPVKHIGAFVKACVDRFKSDNPNQTYTYDDFAIVKVNFDTKNIQLQEIAE